MTASEKIVFKKKPWIFIGGAILFFILTAVVEIINDRFWLNDFLVYFSASDAYLNDQPVYGVAFGLTSGFFKYSPFSVILGLPYQLFTFEIAKYIHYFLMASSSIGAFVLVEGQFRAGQSTLRRQNGLLFLLLLISATHLCRELHLGNINMILVFATVLTVVLIKAEKLVAAAIVLSLIFFFKPYFLILGLPLLVFRRWKLIALIAVSSVGLLLLQLLLFGWSQFQFLYSEWFASMVEHNRDMSSSHTFKSIIVSYIGVDIGSKGSFGLVGLISLGYISLRLFKWKVNQSRYLVLDCFILLALIPNLVTTDTQHFLFSIPLIGFILSRLFERKKYMEISLFIVFSLLYASNSTDILGKDLLSTFNSYAVIGLANLCLIVLAIYLRISGRKRERPK